LTAPDAQHFPAVAAASSDVTASEDNQEQQSQLDARRLSSEIAVPSITSQHPSSNVAFFDLHSFDWACRLPIHTSPDLVSCSLEIRGFSSLEKVVPSAANKGDIALFEYTSVREGIPPVMQRVITLWTAFNGLHTVTFELHPVGSILFLNNLSVLTYNVTDWKDGIANLIHEAGRDGW